MALKNIQRALLFILITLFFGVGGAVVESYLRAKRNDRLSLVEKSKQSLHELEKKSDLFLDKLIISISSHQGNVTNYLFPTPDINGLTVFVFHNDKLAWWSDNSVNPDDLRSGLNESYHILFLKNGWYEYFEKKQDEVRLIGLLKIKNQYAFTNKYLSNEYHSALCLPPTANLIPARANESFELNSYKGNLLFSVNFGEHAEEYIIPGIASAYILAYIFFLLSAYFFMLHFFKSTTLSGFITFVIVIITRLLSSAFSFPRAIFELPFFSPSYYASSVLLNSPGDFLINAILIVYIIGIGFKALRIYLAAKIEHFHTLLILAATGILVLTFLYSAFINYLLSGLIINSRISFNINNVFELDLYSLAGVLIFGILLYSFFLACDGCTKFFLRAGFNTKRIIIHLIISQLVFLVIYLTAYDKWIFTYYGLEVPILTIFLILFCFYIRKKQRNIFSFTSYLIVIFSCCLYAANTISRLNSIKEKENRKLLASKLENEQDQVAEYLFDDIAEKVKTDNFLSEFFSNPFEQILSDVSNEDPVVKRMSRLYFTGYWGKYDINIKCFNKEGLPVNTGGDPTWNLDYFNIIINEDGKPTYSPYLYYISNTSGRITYIGRIPVYAKGEQIGTIIINLTSKILQSEEGFPELLLSDKIPQKRDISNYAYAHYKNDVLINQYGKYNYLLKADFYNSFLNDTLKERYVNFDNYSHFLYKTIDNGLLIVSIRELGILEYVTLFSYLFSFFALCFLLIYGISLLIINRGRVFINFKNRIQSTVITIVITAMLMIGGATVYYIYNNYVNNLTNRVNERLRTMLITVQDELNKRSLEEQVISDELNYTFSKMSGTLGIDFNIYKKDGYLLYSTQPKVFDQGIVAPYMNRKAIDEISQVSRSLLVQYEQIGKLKYLSAYQPVKSTGNNIIGYINLPYFARQSDLKRDISSFLVALINIYVLLFAFSVFVTFIIAGRMTKPLQIIQERLGKIRLGKRNELIEWNQPDEIGSLVKEYNRMVIELSESADMLARSERESAWREMAKQVAHEIKNPLTPMKLSVQHLERAWKEKSPRLNEIMNQFSKTLIEQIDTLSTIATEFSNFAKMPKANNEVIDMAAVLRSCVNLYGKSENSVISYYEHRYGNYQVFADKEQLMRAFSNLIKNAIQSVPVDRSGHIHIEIKNESGKAIASVKDNGSGIPRDETDKIFTPNFTTKTGGMGLGLAIVKSIIENAGGSIWFTTTVNEGSVFYVSLPVYHPDNN